MIFGPTAFWAGVGAAGVAGIVADVLAVVVAVSLGLQAIRLNKIKNNPKKCFVSCGMIKMVMK